jgi:hypothetical protein
MFTFQIKYQYMKLLKSVNVLYKMHKAVTFSLSNTSNIKTNVQVDKFLSLSKDVGER